MKKKYLVKWWRITKLKVLKKTTVTCYERKYTNFDSAKKMFEVTVRDSIDNNPEGEGVDISMMKELIDGKYEIIKEYNCSELLKKVNDLEVI